MNNSTRQAKKRKNDGKVLGEDNADLVDMGTEVTRVNKTMGKAGMQPKNVKNKLIKNKTRKSDTAKKDKEKCKRKREITICD